MKSTWTRLAGSSLSKEDLNASMMMNATSAAAPDTNTNVRPRSMTERRNNDVLNWPQPWFAPTTTIILPRMFVDANSEGMTEDKG